MTCPNRDGTLGTGGCIFCSAGGSGDFAEKRTSSLKEQMDLAKNRVRRKISGNDNSYIAYFQSYTNTYAPLPYLEQLFTEAVSFPEICGLSIGTRPDCLPDGTVKLLAELNRKKPVWVELGLQTIHEDTAKLIRRGYELPVFEDAYRRLKAAGLTVIVHVILGLPGESKEQMLKTVRYLGALHVDGIKLQLLHVLKGTDLAALYRSGAFRTMELPGISGAHRRLSENPPARYRDPQDQRGRTEVSAHCAGMEWKQAACFEFDREISEGAENLSGNGAFVSAKKSGFHERKFLFPTENQTFNFFQNGCCFPSLF